MKKYTKNLEMFLLIATVFLSGVLVHIEGNCDEVNKKINSIGLNEKTVLRAFEKLKASTETGVNLNRYSDLLADANTELNLYKREKEAKGTFISRAEECVGSYEVAARFWGLKLKYESGRDVTGGSERMKTEIQDMWERGSNCVNELYDPDKWY